MDEGSGNQDTCTKVLGKEKDLGRDVHPRYFLCHYREATSTSTSNEHNDLSSYQQNSMPRWTPLTNCSNVER